MNLEEVKNCSEPNRGFERLTFETNQRSKNMAVNQACKQNAQETV